MSAHESSGEPAAPLPPRVEAGHLSLDRASLVAWGEAFGRAARAPLVVTLTGELGAGKTTLAQAICRGYGVRDEVTSPTYSIVQEYESDRTPVYHLDLYRLRGPEELANIGWDDVIVADALVLIEWPERAGAYLPPHVPIRLAHDPAHADHRLLLAG